MQIRGCLFYSLIKRGWKTAHGDKIDRGNQDYTPRDL